MSAPPLIAVGLGPLEPSAARSVRDIAAGTARLRPDLRIQAGFTEPGRESLVSVIAGFDARGETEAVVVPLRIGPDERGELALLTALDGARNAHPGVCVRITEPAGVDPALLAVLDERLRAALRSARVRELDGLVLAADSAGDSRYAAALQRLSRLWSARHHLPVVIAYAHSWPPSTGEAVRDLRRQGRRHVAVGSLFLTDGAEERRAAELALEAGACAVSAPLGAHEEVSRLVLARYAVGALNLVPV